MIGGGDLERFFDVGRHALRHLVPACRCHRFGLLHHVVMASTTLSTDRCDVSRALRMPFRERAHRGRIEAEEPDHLEARNAPRLRLRISVHRERGDRSIVNAGSVIVNA